MTRDEQDASGARLTAHGRNLLRIFSRDISRCFHLFFLSPYLFFIGFAKGKRDRLIKLFVNENRDLLWYLVSKM